MHHIAVGKMHKLKWLSPYPTQWELLFGGNVALTESLNDPIIRTLFGKHSCSPWETIIPAIDWFPPPLYLHPSCQKNPPLPQLLHPVTFSHECIAWFRFGYALHIDSGGGSTARPCCDSSPKHWNLILEMSGSLIENRVRFEEFDKFEIELGGSITLWNSHGL